MEMTDQVRIEASREAVFAALNDTEVLRQAIPGCQEIAKLSDTEFEATVIAKVGPVKAKFTGAVKLSDIDPPNGYTISGEGKGGPAGFAKGGAEVTLEEDGGATLLKYKVTANVSGKLAQLGGRLIEGTSKKLAGEFFSKFKEIVERPSEEAAPEAAPAAAPAPEKAGISPLLLGAGVIAIAAIVILLLNMN